MSESNNQLEKLQAWHIYRKKMQLYVSRIRKPGRDRWILKKNSKGKWLHRVVESVPSD